MLKNMLKIIKKSPIIAILGLLIIIGLFYSGFKVFESKKEENKQETTEQIKKQVNTKIINKNQDNNLNIKTVGLVKPETQIDITSIARGTAEYIFFDVGDNVSVNSLLASMYDNSTLTSLNNAQINLLNTQANERGIERLSQESIRAAELGLENANENLRAAEIALDSSQNNLDNAKVLKDKNKIDTKNNAIISYNNFLNFIFSGLNDVDYIIDVEEGGLNLESIKSTLGVLNLESLDTAKKDYFTTKTNYLNVSAENLTTENIELAINKMERTLSLFKKLVDDMIIVIDNTVTSASFTDANLSAEKARFIALRSTTIGKQTELANIKQALGNLDLFYNQEIDALSNAVTSAENRLKQAEVGVQNAENNLASARIAAGQQLNGAKSGTDNAFGQLNLARAQASNLNIKAPISGQITAKYIELGAEVNPGQKIAQISQVDNLVIELGLPSEDVYRIKLFQIVSILDGLNGVITSIDPVADPITKKVKIKITFDNKDKQLIPGTFVDITIPLENIEKTTENSIFVPLRSVIISQNENFVFVNNNGIAKKLCIKIGKTEGALVEIIEGLNDGDELIIEGAKNLEDGDRLEVKK